MLTGWTGRVTKAKRSKATWAAIALAAISLLVQLTNFIKSDLKPLIESSRTQIEKLTRIEQSLEDHERRIQQLERKNSINGIYRNY